MSDYKPLVLFLIVTLVLNFFITDIYDTFGETPDTSTLPDLITTYLEIQDEVSDFVTALGNVLFIGDVLAFLANVLMLGLFTDTMADAIIIWALIPTTLFYILFIPLFTGFVYSIIKLLPTT